MGARRSALRVAGRSRARGAGPVVHRRAHRRGEAGRRDRARCGAHSPPLHGGDGAEGLKTQVAIIGGGPAGLLLAELLDRQGVETVVLEKHSREHVLSRIRAGVLEPTTVGLLREFEKVYPFGWLGVLSPVPPLPEIAYCHSSRGFALASQRNPTLSRYYLQVPLETRIDDWPDGRFWEELKRRFPPAWAERIGAGPSTEKSIAPLRSYVAEPMQYARLFLAGDAAHIVPPTGAKGLNLAVSDVYYLARALAEFYRTGSRVALDAYSETALRRVWASVRISWYLTMLLHLFPGASAFDQRAQEYELAYLQSSHPAQVALAEQYAGLPL